jgi:hypothetical protein
MVEAVVEIVTADSKDPATSDVASYLGIKSNGDVVKIPSLNLLTAGTNSPVDSLTVATDGVAKMLGVADDGSPVQVGAYLEATGFTADANIFNANEPGAQAANTAKKVTSTGTHTIARFADHLEVHAEGSGLAEGPQRADFAMSRSIFKDGYPSLTADDGEIDTIHLSYRQVNGDAALILGNGVIINGFGAVLEARIDSIEPTAPYARKHSVNVQVGVTNDRDDTYYGYIAQKAAGTDGTGLYINSLAGAENGFWTRNFEFVRDGKVQMEHTVSDSMITMYQYDSTVEKVSYGVAGGEFKFLDKTGADLVNLHLAARPTSYTPTVTVNSGTITATVNSAVYFKTGKKVDVHFDITVTALTGSPGYIELTHPLTPSSGKRFAASGINLNTNQSIIVYDGASGTARIVLYTGAFPASAGHNLIGHYSFYTA